MPILLLYPDNTEACAETREEIIAFDGIFGIEKESWDKVRNRELFSEHMQGRDKRVRQSPEELLLGAEEDRVGICQLKGGKTTLSSVSKSG